MQKEKKKIPKVNVALMGPNSFGKTISESSPLQDCKKIF